MDCKQNFECRIIAIVIIFQPELRKALEDLGNKISFLNILKWLRMRKCQIFRSCNGRVIRATLELAKNKTGPSLL